MDRVLVCGPCYYNKEYCLDKFVQHVKSLDYGNYDIILADNSKGGKYRDKIKSLGIDVIKTRYVKGAMNRIVRSRNELKDYAIENGYDYVLFVDQDIFLPRDTITRLLRHNKDLITGVYTKQYSDKSEKVMFLYYDPNKKKLVQPKLSQVPRDYLIPIVAAGLGVTLVKVDILQGMKFRHDKRNRETEDTCFYKDCLLKGVKAYCDTGLVVGHEPSSWDELDIE